MAFPFLALGLFIQAAGTVKSVQASNKAAKAQRKQQKLTTRRSRRQAVRQSQIARAQATASAQGSGSFGSSGFAGGVGSISSQLGSAIGFQNQQNQLSNIVSTQSQSADLFGSVAQFGGTLQGIGRAQGQTLFSGKTEAPDLTRPLF